MVSRAPATLVWLWRQVEALPDYPTAAFSGIVPDAAHLGRGGYHVSIEDLAAHGNGGDYSNTRPLDKIPPVTRPSGEEQSAALDISLAKSDMVRLYGRVKAIFDDRSDPRHQWLNYWNVWNGVTGNLPARFNFQTHTVGTTDRSHEWHSHEDRPRAYVDLSLNEANCWTAARAALSVWKGETAAQWLAAEGDDMTKEEHDWLYAVMRAIFYGGSAAATGGCGPLVPIYDAAGNEVGKGNSVFNKLDHLVKLAGEGTPPAPADVAAIAVAVTAALTPEIRDAVADLGEGGAVQVRADQD